MSDVIVIRKKLVKRIGLGCAGAALSAVLMPKQATAQFGLDIAVIVAGMQSINSALSSFVAVPLQYISKIQAAEQKFQQVTVYPQQAINKAQGLAGQFTAPYNQISSLMKTNIVSATMALPKQLETQLLSANANSVGSVAASYAQVYGTLPAQTAAPANVRASIDMSDAQAQDALKKAILLDALADREIEIAKSLNDQLKTAAPGTAPILDAEASAWVLQGNAYSQSAMASLLRLRSAQLSNASSALKNETAQAQQFNLNLQGVIKH